jgi:uncharacterized membrane protein
LLITGQLFEFFPYSVEGTKRKQFVILAVNNLLLTSLMAHVLACFWVKANNVQAPTQVQIYLDSLQFVFATASTVGYGDQTVNKTLDNNTNERFIFAIAIIVLALIFFAYIQSFIRKLLEKWNQTQAVFEQEIADLEDWITIRNVSALGRITLKYEKLVKNYIEYMSRNDLDHALNSYGFIELLSPSDRLQVEDCATATFAHKFSFFHGMSVESSSALILSYEAVK